MPEAARVALVLLAAGRSLRFGARDKLAEPLRGTPLALNAVAALARLPVAIRIAVTGTTAIDFAAHGYAVVPNDEPAAGQSRSIALGVAAARAAGADAVLIALADMPFVAEAHVRDLLAHAGPARTLVASSDGSRPSPPALFGRAHFATLERLDGDTGARALLRQALLVAAPPGTLIDIDTPEELARCEASIDEA